MLLFEDLCRDGDVRLEGGFREYEGRIEICYKREWGTVCNDGINGSVAEVVCRQLGFSLHSKTQLLQCQKIWYSTVPCIISVVPCKDYWYGLYPRLTVGVGKPGLVCRP